jgi:hypothetical protein
MKLLSMGYFILDVSQWLDLRRKDLMILMSWVSHPHGTVVRAEAQRSGDPCFSGSSPTMGSGCLSFGGDNINRATVLQKVWHEKEEAMSAKHRSTFAALSHLMVTAAG